MSNKIGSRKYKDRLAERLIRQKAFHNRKERGDLLVYVNRGYADLEHFLTQRLFQRQVSCMPLPPDNKVINGIIKEFVQLMRESYERCYAVEDDEIPCAFVYAGIGIIVAAMTGKKPKHDEDTSWLEPNLSWEEIERLRFDAANPWVQFALHINQALWNYWEEDFFILPFLHRSPLDSANGIRGSALFEEMYSAPGQVKKLVDWCCDWSITMERFLDENVSRRKGWGNGVWSTWLPDKAVFVNGDPVGLISREMQQEFERPYTEKLFLNTGGGFFHNHTLGLYQVDQVAETKGLIVQEFAADPKIPTVPEVLLNDAARRKTIMAASLRAPIMIDSFPLDLLDRLLPILKEGRFIIGLCCSEDVDPSDAIRKIRQTSTIK